MLYHQEIGLPEGSLPPKGRFKLEYTEHARRAAKSDRYGDLTPHLPDWLDTTSSLLVELETFGRGYPAKYLFRIGITPALDLLLAVCPARWPWRVKTCWANESTDSHSTLDKSRYEVVT